MPTKEIRWPMRGVVRRETLRSTPDHRGPWPSPWAVNVRVSDPIDRRLRGGSRPGLTLFVDDEMGTTIADMASIHVSSAAGGASEILFVMVDSGIKTVESGVTTTQAGVAPSSGFLVTGQQYVFAVTTSAIEKMDPKTGTVESLVASAGTIPTNCTFGAVYRDRFCLSGEDNAIYMSRQGDYTNWSYGTDVSDTRRALPFQLSLAADVGDAPTAMIACKDDYLICATARSLWVVRGDPATGSLERISERVGIIGSRAWVKIDQTIVLLAEDGLYQVSADGSNLTPLTPDTIPAELRDIDTSTTTVSMGYEHDRRAFHIYLRTAGGSDTHWLYEIESQAFWPMRLQDDHSPLAVAQHQGELLLAGGDGYVRQVGGDDDDTAAIQSHVAIGPLRLGSPGHFGRILKMHAMLAAGSGEVNWRVVTGDTAEEAADNAKTAIETFQAEGDYSSYVKASGNWIGGRSIAVYPRVRSVWCCLWLQSTNKWAFEGLTLETMISGKWRGSSAGVVRAGVVSPSSSPSTSPSASTSASPSASPSSSPSATPSSSPSSSPSST